MDLQKFNAPDVKTWIEENQNVNIYKLALKNSPFENIPMPELINQVLGRQISSKKFKILFSNNDIIFPPKINLEQTSSSATAIYKSKLIKGKSIIDITGGFGIDCLYFSQTFESVYHIEKNQSLQEIAKHNFKMLEKNNIHSYHDDGIQFLDKNQLLNDVLYIDPARRNENHKKVFLLEDLTPDILPHLNNWQSRFKEIWVKLSPMIDVQYLINHVPNLSQIHLIAVKNELKEVLIQIKKNTNCKIITTNLETNHPDFTFMWNVHPSPPIYSEVETYLYEPNAAIQKSGFNDSMCDTFELKKLHPNSQLFTSNSLINNFPGKVLKILKQIKNPKKELKGQSIQAIHRNFPTSLINLRKKYKFTTDGTHPIVFTQTKNNVLILEAELMTN